MQECLVSITIQSAITQMFRLFRDDQGGAGMAIVDTIEARYLLETEKTQEKANILTLQCAESSRDAANSANGMTWLSVRKRNEDS
jgi:hypothetical protein